MDIFPVSWFEAGEWEYPRYYQVRESGQSYGPVVAVTQERGEHETELCSANPNPGPRSW